MYVCIYLCISLLHAMLSIAQDLSSFCIQGPIMTGLGRPFMVPVPGVKPNFESILPSYNLSSSPKCVFFKGICRLVQQSLVGGAGVRERAMDVILS